jgi:hypothetical protein
MRKTVFALTLAYLAVAALGSRSAGLPEFDRLSDADRKAFQERFVKEIWPLMSRNGKDGCVGCHGSGKLMAALRLSGDPAKDFPYLLKEGFFDHGDRGSLLGRITEENIKRRMPFERAPWKGEEIAVLRRFSIDMDAKQKKR